MTPSDPDKRFRELIAKAFIPPDGCDADSKALEAMLDAAAAEPFSDDQVERMLKKAKGELPLGEQPDEPEWAEANLTEEEEALLALHRREGGKLPEEIQEKLRRFREKARKQPKVEDAGEE